MDDISDEPTERLDRFLAWLLESCKAGYLKEAIVNSMTSRNHLESRVRVSCGQDERAKLKGEVRNLEGEISRHLEDFDLTPEALYSPKDQTAEYFQAHERLQVEKSIVDVRLKESEASLQRLLLPIYIHSSLFN